MIRYCDHNYPSGSASASADSSTTGSTHSYWVCSLSQVTMPSASLPPLYSMGSADLSLPQNLRVGKPWMSRPETSFSVESTLTSRMLGLLAILLAASSQWGAKCLQWPHQGAQNFTKTSCSESRTTCLKFLPTTTLTGSSLGSGMGADLRKGWISPLLTLATKEASPSAVMASSSYLYFSLPSFRSRTVGVDWVSTPRYSASLSNSPWPSFLVEMARTTSGAVSSQALRASWASAYAASSPRKRKTADCFFWKMASMAELSKGMISAWRRTRTARRAINFMVFMYIQ